MSHDAECHRRDTPVQLTLALARACAHMLHAPGGGGGGGTQALARAPRLMPRVVGTVHRRRWRLMDGAMRVCNGGGRGTHLTGAVLVG